MKKNPSPSYWKDILWLYPEITQDILLIGIINSLQLVEGGQYLVEVVNTNSYTNFIILIYRVNIIESNIDV